MSYVTGDTHGSINIGKLSTKNFPDQKHMSKSDYLIICGDFGGVWDGSKEEQYWRKWLKQKPFTTLFVDGNHENFPALNSYDVQEWNGGKVHKIEDSIFHLMRGQVYQIDGYKFFSMGGASSHDKEYRIEGWSWWAEELPSTEEYLEALANLDKNNWNVDFVISHCAPDSVQTQIKNWYEKDKLTNFMESIKNDLSFSHWFFGHYHTDWKIDDKYTAMFNCVKRVV